MVIMACPSKETVSFCACLCVQRTTSGLLNSVVGSGKAQTITDIYKHSMDLLRFWFQHKKIEVILAYLQLVHHFAEDLTKSQLTFVIHMVELQPITTMYF